MNGFQLRITVKHTSPPVWRRLSIPVRATFENLNSVIQEIFGWKQKHLWEFRLPGRHLIISDTYEFADESADVTLRSRLSVGDRFFYIYDFGENWEHEIVTEGLLSDCADCARLLDAGGAYMIEDCGGPVGYEKRSRFAALFDPDAANEVLANIFIGNPAISVRSIRDVLEHYRKSELMQMAGAHGLRKFQACRKPELVRRLADRLLLRDHMVSEMERCGREEMEIFEAAMEEDGIQCPEETVRESRFLCSYGAYLETGEYLVPMDVQGLYRAVCTKEYRIRRFRQWELTEYCKSAVYLYGVVPVDELARIINGYENRGAVAEKEIRFFLRRVENEKIRGPLAVRGDVLMDVGLAEEERFGELLKRQQDIPYYIPVSKKEFLRYGKAGCQEPDAKTEFFLTYAVKELQIELEQACGIFFIFQEIIRRGLASGEFADKLELLITPLGRRRRKLLEYALGRLGRLIRQWDLRGFTLEEMYPAAAKVVPFRIRDRP